MSDDPADRPTIPPVPPIRPTAQRLFAPPEHSERVTDAQHKILDGLRAGIKNLVDRFFDGAGPTVRMAVLHATLDDYHDGLQRGRSQAVLVYQSYLDVLDRRHAGMRLDPRTDYVRPSVSAAELHEAISLRGAGLSYAEVVVLAGEMSLALAPPDANQ